MSDDTSLEDAFRSGLQRRAEAADTAVDLLGPARSGARARRRRRFAVTGAVGLAAAALVTAVVVQNAGGPDGPDGTTVLDSVEPLPTEWRTEAWHTIQVEVPADWAWGSAPVESGGESLRCGGPDEDVPYVGRPVMASDVCAMAKHLEPTAPYVWLGADVEPGTVEVGNGLVQTTVEVEGTRLTVATRDPRLTDLVIRSAVPTRACRPQLDRAPTVETMLIEGLAEPRSALVCAYAPREERDESGPYDLVYLAELDAAGAAAFHAAAYDGGTESSPRFCASSTGERVLVTVNGVDPMGGGFEVSQDLVVDPGCREVQGSPGMVSPLGDAGMDAWAVGGLPVTLYGLIGPMG
jgi:hypothetical protein